MRKLLFGLAAVVFTAGSALAGRLDLAIIQFPEEKTVPDLEAALANVDLFKITDSDRTMTTEAYLKGGYVLFAASFPASPGSAFSYVTRVKNFRADVEGKLGSGSVSVDINLIEGVKAGIRNFEKKNYVGSSSLAAGSTRVLSMKAIHGTAPHVIKGVAKPEEYFYMTALIAHYTP